MREIYAYFAAEWLEQKLLPLAIKAAGLPPEMKLDELEHLNLPIPNSPEFAQFANSEAGTLCSQRPLFCAVMLAATLSQTAQARRIAGAIYGLMWRDGVEYALARDLDMACNGDGFNAPDYAERFDLADQQWQRWSQTDEAVIASNQDFLSDCVDQRLAGYRPLE